MESAGRAWANLDQTQKAHYEEMAVCINAGRPKPAEMEGRERRIYIRSVLSEIAKWVKY
jgi:hypothetical protein